MSRLGLVWGFLVVVSVAGLAGGVLFRRGPIPAYLAWYRNTTLPAAIRNVPIMLPFIAAFVLPLAVLVTPFALGLWEPPASRPAQGFLVFGAAAWGVVAGGSLIALGSRLPRGLVPRWLRDEDRQIRFEPKEDWFDQATLAAGALLVAFGLGLAGLAVWAILDA